MRNDITYVLLEYDMETKEWKAISLNSDTFLQTGVGKHWPSNAVDNLTGSLCITYTAVNVNELSEYARDLLIVEEMDYINYMVCRGHIKIDVEINSNDWGLGKRLKSRD